MENTQEKNTVEINTSNQIDLQIQNVLTSLKQLNTNISSTMKAVQTLQKNYEKEVNKSKKGTKKPPPDVNLNQEMAAFLGEEYPLKMTRGNVIKEISKYIRNNGLQVPENKKKFRPNDKLQDLLTIPNGVDELSFLQINKYVSNVLE